MEDNSNTLLVRLILITFGDTSSDESAQNAFSREHMGMIVRTFFLIPLCLWFTQAWLQTKWLDIRVTLD